MSLKQELAAIIRSARESTGMTQEELASSAGISTRFYQDIEAAEKQPSIDTIFKLSKALNVEYTKLLKPVWKKWLKENH